MRDWLVGMARKVWRWTLVAVVAWAVPLPANAASITVSAGGVHFAEALSAARPGDELVLAPGVHHGPVIIKKSIVLTGMPGSEIRGNGEGSTVTVGAPDVTIKTVKITKSGNALSTMDSGIFVNKKGDRAVIENNVIEDNLFGVYFWGPENAVMRANVVIGRKGMHVNQRGNGVSLWNTPGSIVENNDFRYGRDGIFTTTSRGNIFRNNRFRGTRIAVHYMYTNNSTVSGNLSLGNHVGFAIMFSKGLNVTGNTSVGDRDHGILLNYANGSRIEGNVVKDGKTKCVFIYNSNKNIFRGNRFENCPIGIHFTAGSERNEISSNAFVGNRTQVKYVGTRHLEWSVNGRGNYWSDNPAFDLDGDGIANAAYRPNDLVDKVLWTHPAAKVLINSPSIQILRWAQARFPALLPGGVVDSAPLMTLDLSQLRKASKP